MPDPDRRPAIHATPTSALRAVTVLLAVVLLLAAALAVLDALSPLGSPGARHGPHTQRPIQHLALTGFSCTAPRPWSSEAASDRPGAPRPRAGTKKARRTRGRAATSPTTAHR